jgi:four helix bundle protein
MNNEGKIREFTDLNVWREGHALVLFVYRITKTFPREETYSLTDQMRRAASSVTSNIAEGFGRHGYKEKVQFYYLAQGSLTELKNQLIIARDVGYLTPERFAQVSELADTTHRLLQGLIRKSKTFVK